jgi:hypothetical protein
MYTVINYKTKKEVVEAVKSGRQVAVFQPNAGIFGHEKAADGSVYLEGPHYPQPHRWYAQGVAKDGVLVSVK